GMRRTVPGASLVKREIARTPSEYSTVFCSSRSPLPSASRKVSTTLSIASSSGVPKRGAAMGVWSSRCAPEEDGAAPGPLTHAPATSRVTVNPDLILCPLCRPGEASLRLHWRPCTEPGAGRRRLALLLPIPYSL